MKTDRKEFLRMMVAATAFRPLLANASLQQAVATTQGTQPFVQQVMNDYAAALGCALCYIGDRLGLFKTMAQSGPVTAVNLARTTRLNARMLREWLNGLTAAGYREYRAIDKTYLLPKDHAAVLADEESSPMFKGGLFQFLVPVFSATPQVAQTFQTGKPAVFSSEMDIAGERSFGTAYRHELVQKWIPMLPGIQEKLAAGASALDLACGAGIVSVVLAKAFPKSEFAGYDPSAPSIERARDRARKEGVSDRVEFVAADASHLPRGRFDLITIFNSFHHFNDPVAILRHCREALKPGGTCFIVDLNLSPNPEENINLGGRVGYAVTTLVCLQDSMANDGVGLGSELNEVVLKGFAAKTGFSACRVLGGSTPMRAYYELRA